MLNYQRVYFEGKIEESMDANGTDARIFGFNFCAWKSGPEVGFGEKDAGTNAFFYGKTPSPSQQISPKKHIAQHTKSEN